MANVTSIERLNEHARIEHLDDGTHRVTLQRGQHYFDRDTGRYEASDSNIYPDQTIPGFTWNTKAGSARARLAPGGRFRFGLRHPLFVTYRPRGAQQVTPIINGHTAYFFGLWPSVNLELTKFPEGTKEDLILLDASAPSSYTWDLEEIAGVVPTPAADGGLDYVETLTGEVIGRIPAPTVHDAAGVAGIATLTYSAGAVTIAVDPAWLADPARQFPVALDPTTIVLQPDPTAGKDSYVYQGGPTTNYGTATFLAIGDSDTVNLAYRSFLQPDLSSIPSGKIILSAQLELYTPGGGTVGANLTANLYRVTSSWGEATITWNVQPTFDTTVHSSVAGIDTTAGWRAWTGLATLVQNWYVGSWTNYGVVIRKATDGSTSSDIKNFHSSDYTTNTTLRPKWTITYTTPPTVTITSPAGTQTTPTQINDDVTPDLSGVYNSAEPANMAYRQHQVYDELSNLVWDSAKTAATATPGSAVTVTVPASVGLKYGTKYKWRWMAWDVDGASSPWSAEGWFQAVLSAPTGLAATADSANARINLSWTAHTGENLAGYRVYRRKQGAGSWTLLNQTLVTSPAYNDDAVARGQVYEYQATAVATDGYESPASAVATGSVTWTAGQWWLGSLNLTDKVYDCQPTWGFKTSRAERVGTQFPGVQSSGPSGRLLAVGLRLDSEAELEALVVECSKPGVLSLRDPLGRVWRVKLDGDIRLAQVQGSGVYYNAVLRLTEVA